MMEKEPKKQQLCVIRKVKKCSFVVFVDSFILSKLLHVLTQWLYNNITSLPPFLLTMKLKNEVNKSSCET